MLNLFIVIILVILIIYKFNKPKIKGRVGEFSVAKTLTLLPKHDYIVLNNLLLKTGRSSSQIDHLVVSKYGLFVIETKRFCGWIHGHERSQLWTQTFYKKKVKFRNPIKQNWSHIYALKEILSDYNSIKYYNIVVFTGNSKLKNITSSTPVIYRRKLNRVIKSYSNKKSLDLEEMNAIVAELDAIGIQSRRSKKEHVSKTKKEIYEANRKKKMLICPRCTGDLVVRKGKYGKFYGCSNYPQCRFTMPYKRR